MSACKRNALHTFGHTVKDRPLSQRSHWKSCESGKKFCRQTDGERWSRNRTEDEIEVDDDDNDKAEESINSSAYHQVGVWKYPFF